MNRKKNTVPGSLIFMILVLAVVMVLFISYVTGFSGGIMKTVSGYLFVPMQKGLETAGSGISERRAEAGTVDELREENRALTEQVEDLTTQLNNVQLQKSELEDLEKLYALDQEYADYKKTGARVIARGASNWFSTFTIDKGTDDGIRKNMNVIAGSGLCGYVYETGKNYSVVKSVIDDTSNVSSMTLSGGDICIVSGSLERMNQENRIDFTDLEDPDGKIESGEPVVTSNISSIYLPGILIGYIDSIQSDSNELTKSGTITPAVDFKHLTNVLVILDTKETGAS